MGQCRGVYRSVKFLLRITYVFATILFLTFMDKNFTSNNRNHHARSISSPRNKWKEEAIIHEEYNNKMDANSLPENNSNSFNLEENYWMSQLRIKKFDQKMPNLNFVFHNKLPKSGSSTMNNILKVLHKKHNFKFLKIEPGPIATYDTDVLIDHIAHKKVEPFLLLKHHQYFDFTEYNEQQPTYINVMRDPLEWFTSRYYFARYGWSRRPGCRIENCGMTEKEVKMDIDECVAIRHTQCTYPWMYVQFFCGTAPVCNLTTTSTSEQKEKATELAKYNILHKYHVVGILEQFEDTLTMFDKLLPDYFKGAVNIWKSSWVQSKQSQTKTMNKKEMSEESKEYFRNGPLHYEIELYNFARTVFNERLRRMGITPAVVL